MTTNNNSRPQVSIKVLVVDDSPSDRTIFRRYLSQDTINAYEFVETEHIDNAFEMIIRNAPDCLLLDYDLPDGKGTDLIEKITEHFGKNKIPIVMLSGSGSIEIAVETLRSGAHDYLVKSRVTPDELVRAVNNAIEKVNLFRDRQAASEIIKTSEERYKLLFDNTPLPAIVFDRENLAILAANDCAVRHYGYSRAEFLNMTLHALDSFDGASSEIVLHEFCEDEKTIRTIPARHRKKDGTITDVEINCHDIKFYGRDARFVIVQDITERRLIEKEREESLAREKELRQQAESANLSKDEFLAVLSHELRSPLNAMSGWAKMLKLGVLDESKTKQAIDVIERNISLQNHLIEDLLDISRIISGKLKIELVELNLCKIISEAVESARILASEKNIALVYTAHLEECSGFGDPNRLQQIFNNLLTNSIKFTPENGNVDVSLKTDKNFAEIKITDDGIGIDSETLPHIFERFRQADGSTKRKYGGLGLGLAIVRSLIEMHNGTITAESGGINQGAVFIIKIPVKSNNEDEKKIENHPKKNNWTSEIKPSLNGVKILIVDDESDSLELLSFVLESNGAIVRSYDNADGALNSVEDFDPDILISDISMAEMDGYDLIQRLREMDYSKNRFLPAIAMTAYTSVEDRARILSAGFQKHISKPFDVEEIIQQIKQTINSVNKM